MGPVSMYRELFLSLCEHSGTVAPLPEGTLLLAVVISSCYKLESCEVGGDCHTDRVVEARLGPAIVGTWP